MDSRLFYLLFILLVSCISEVRYPDTGKKYLEEMGISDSSNFIYYDNEKYRSFDSVLYNESFKELFQSLNEPNLGFKPKNEPIYRLLYLSAMDRPAVIILKDKRIELKLGISGYGEPYFDTCKLSRKEALHWYVLERLMEVDVRKGTKREKFIDSIKKADPEINEISYYSYLARKAITWGENPLKYETTEILISHKEYVRLVNKINESGFWNEPFQRDCPLSYLGTDGWTFVLEANTPKTYQIVTTGSCNVSTRMYQNAWEEVMEYANLFNRKPMMPHIFNKSRPE